MALGATSRLRLAAVVSDVGEGRERYSQEHRPIHRGTWCKSWRKSQAAKPEQWPRRYHHADEGERAGTASRGAPAGTRSESGAVSSDASPPVEGRQHSGRQSAHHAAIVGGYLQISPLHYGCLDAMSLTSVSSMNFDQSGSQAGFDKQRHRLGVLGVGVLVAIVAIAFSH